MSSETPRARAAWALLLGAACVLGGCGGEGEGEGRATPTHALAFDHARHAEAGIGCADCHGAPDARPDGTMALPELTFCNECHEDEEDEGTRAFLTGLAARPADARWVLFSPRAEVVFSHRDHGATDCATCHGDVAASTATDVSVAPTMASCVACHTEQPTAGTDCAACHRERRRDVAPPSHRREWSREHGVEARFGSLDTVLQGECAYCHQRDTCLECHRQREPRDHTQFFRIRGHGLQAANDRQACAACHQPDACVRCHAETRPLSHRGSFGAPRDQHCTSCHLPLQGESCWVCHKSTPSHALATPRSARHVQGLNCRQCHGATASLPHADDGSDCTLCHR